MAVNMLPRNNLFRGIAAIVKQPLQCTTFQESNCGNHNIYRTSMMQAASTEESTRIKAYKEIPGPAPLPIIGNVWRFLPKIGEYHGMGIQDLHWAIYNKYGDIVRFGGFPGRPDLLFVFRPEDMETVLRNEGPWPMREGMQAMSYYRKVYKKDFYREGGGVLTEQGSKWMKARTMANQPMMQPRISKRYIQPIAGVAQEFVDKMQTLKNEKEEMPDNFINELFKWSLESIAYVALDTRLGCLAPNLAADSEPQRMINAVGDFFEYMFTLEIGVPVWKIYSTSAWKKFSKALDVFLEVSVNHVNEAVARANKRKLEGTEESEPSVLERMLTKGDVKSATIMAQDMLFGGVDTTSYSVANSMYQLSKNMDKQEMLFQELKRLLPNKNDQITEEKLEEMKYLKACIKESARTLPILSGNLRTSVKDLVISNYRVPKGVWILMPSTISRLSDEYFPMGKRYIPERWLKRRPTGEASGSPEDYDVTSKGKKNPFAFIPFGFGPRSCIGKRFAELEMEILLAKVVRNFKIEYNYRDIKFVSKVLNTPTDPLRFKITERKE